MKVSYRKYKGLVFADKAIVERKGKQVLEMLKKMSRDPRIVPDEDRNFVWSEMRLFDGVMLNKPIYFVSQAFMEAVRANKEKIEELGKDWDIAFGALEECVLVFSGGYMSIIFYRQDEETFYNIVANWENVGIRHCISQTKEAIGAVCTMDKDEALKMQGAINAILLFKKYASVELETIQAGKKKEVKGVERGKVVNDMGIDITMLDSTWFREIIRNEGFKVRGHFRLQPCKNENGEWTRKIIYIEEFEKHGYHRRAKMEIESATQ